MLARGGKWLEMLVLALGLGGGATMVWAGLQFGGRGEWVGRFELDRVATDLTTRASAAWREFVDSGRIADVAGQRARLQTGFLALALEPESAPSAFAEASAFDALLAEALRQQQGRATIEQVRELLATAERLGPPADRRALLELRYLQLALAAGDLDAARARWENLAPGGQVDVTGWSPAGELPAVVYAALALGPRLEAEQAAKLSSSVFTAVADVRLRFSPEDLGVAPGPGPSLDELLAHADAGSENATENATRNPESRAALALRSLRTDEALTTRLQASAAVLVLERLRTAHDWARALDLGFPLDLASLPSKLELESGDVHLTYDGEQTLEVLRLAPGALVRTFREHLAERVTPAAGFAFRTAAEAADLGLPPESLLGPALPLGDFGPVLRLAHDDVAGFVRAESGRQDTLRRSLFALGALTVLASAFAAGALRRQRLFAALKTEFIAKVSHELRTPVTGILLASEGLDESKSPSPERRARYVGLIRKEAERLERLVANILDFSRLDRGAAGGDWLRREPMAAGRCAEGLVERLTERFGGPAGQLGFELEYEPGQASDHELLADLEALGRALGNLVENAHFHGGTPRPRVSIISSDGLVLAVEDDGPGVSASARAHVFSPFEQGGGESAVTGGAGLGLSIVREIALAHGGDVTLQAAASGGYSRFELHVPASGPSERGARDRTSLGDEGNGGDRETVRGGDSDEGRGSDANHE
ncbi:MAG: HAMP domain-containing sensor histidine kinase [Planctomycetota bacterium]|nr:HAMP domain-containing sensor histidine kinase [Planctomycetota bacterium]